MVPDRRLGCAPLSMGIVPWAQLNVGRSWIMAPVSGKITQPADERREWVLFLIIFAIGVSLRVSMLLHLTVVLPDSPGYIYDAAAIGSEGVRGLFTKGFGSNFSIYPLFIHFTNLVVGDLVLSGRLVSVFFGSLLLLLVYLLARDMFGSRIGLIAAFLLAVHPHLIRYSGEILKDTTLAFFAVSSVLLAFVGCTRGKRWLVFLAGISAWATALVRLYGIIIVPCVCTAIVVYGLTQKEGMKETLLRLALFLLPMPLVGYIAFLVFVGPENEFIIRSFVKVVGVIPQRIRENGTYAEILINNNPTVNPAYLELITRYPYVSATAHFLGVFATAFFPFYFVLLCFGLFLDRKNLFVRGTSRFILSLAAVFILFDLAIVNVFFFITKRHTIPLAIILLPWSAVPIEWVMTRLRKYALDQDGIKRSLLSSIIPLFAVIWVVSSFIYAGSPSRESVTTEYKKTAGEYIKETGGDDPVIIVPGSDELVHFYAGGEEITLWEPGDLEGSIDANEPDFVIWDTDLGPLPEAYLRLTEGGRIELVRTIVGKGDDAIYIYRPVSK
jgi:hypothetical protein